MHFKDVLNAALEFPLAPRRRMASLRKAHIIAAPLLLVPHPHLLKYIFKMKYVINKLQ